MSDRFYVSLSATVDADQLDGVLADMQAAMRSVGAAQRLDGLSLSFTREDDDGALTGDTQAVPLPVDVPPAGPVVSTGPGTPPPDATPAPIVPDPAVPDPDPLAPAPATADGAHAAPEETP